MVVAPQALKVRLSAELVAVTLTMKSLGQAVGRSPTWSTS